MKHNRYYKKWKKQHQHWSPDLKELVFVKFPDGEEICCTVKEMGWQFKDSQRRVYIEMTANTTATKWA